jgi:membrane protease YdiL (CAAX protease family)
MAVGSLISTVVLTPVTEEVLFRGYLFRQLYARAGWPFVPAVITTAFLFGLAHLPAVWGHAGRDAIAGEIGSVAIGGVFFSWLFVRWSYDLWIPIAVHGFMNLWCEMVSCDEALGSGATLVGRVLTVIAACGLTLVVRRKQRTRAS